MIDSNWVMAGIMMTLMFFSFGIIFAVMKEKGASLIAGYNFKSKEERKKYDEKRMCIDMRNNFFVQSLIFLVGTIATFFGGTIWFWIAFVVWLIYFFKNFHLDPEKAFGKYRRDN